MTTGVAGVPSALLLLALSMAPMAAAQEPQSQSQSQSQPESEPEPPPPSSCIIDESGRYSAHPPVNLLVLEAAKLGNVHARAAEFAAATGATVQITPVAIADWQAEVFADAGRGGPGIFDGYSVKGNWVPSLVEAGGLADLDELVDAGDVWTDIEWTDIVPVVRDSICVYNSTIYSVPVDADYIVTVVRDDLLLEEEEDGGGDGQDQPAAAGSSTLETWEEYVAFAERQHGRDINGDSIADYGACLAKGEGDTHFSVFAPLWTMAAPYLQREGRTAGAFFDTNTLDPLWMVDPALDLAKALELYRRLVAVAMPGPVTALQAKKLFQEGRCATWLSLPGFVFGVQDTGGVQAASRPTASMKRLPTPGVVCASDTACPLAEQSAAGLINRAPFFATSGTALSIGSKTTESTRQLLFELFTYIAAPAQSNQDVTLRSSFSDPFRNSQLGDAATALLVAKNGWDESVAADYHAVVSDTLNSYGAALDLRVPGGKNYQSAALLEAGPYVYHGEGSAAEAAARIAEAWEPIPTEIFEGSEPEAARSAMLSVYRAQLGLPPIVKDQSGSGINVRALIISLSLLGGLCLLAVFVAFVLWVRRTYRRKQQLEEESAALIEMQMSEAEDVVKQFQAPLVLMKGTDFVELGSLKSHEDLRDEGRLKFLDTSDQFETNFRNNFTSIFFSHQWTGDSHPDPQNIQYGVMCTALREVAAREQRPLAEIYVWVDFFSIPQANRAIQRLAIASLPALASILDYFVAICPPADHAATLEQCGHDSYFRRCWTRAEMMSFWSRRGDNRMFYADGNTTNGSTNGASSILRSLDPKDSVQESQLDAVRVFQGQLTCCRLQHNGGTQPCDREELMLPMLGLYGEIYARRTQPTTKLIHDAIDAHLDRIYPSTFEYEVGGGKVTRVLFGDLIAALRHRLDCRSGKVAPEALELGKLSAGTMGSQETVHGRSIHGRKNSMSHDRKNSMSHGRKNSMSHGRK